MAAHGGSLRPFFADTSSYYEYETTTGDNKTSIDTDELKKNPDPYLGPLVVIINNGSRSGKEALAYQFKKLHRATLVGESTAGYFSGAGTSLPANRLTTCSIYVFHELHWITIRLRELASPQTSQFLLKLLGFLQTVSL